MSDSSPRSWAPPDVDGPVVSSRGRSTSVADLNIKLEAARELLFEESRRRGYKQGMADVAVIRDQLRLDASRLHDILAQICSPLANLEDDLVTELTELALAIGKQLARRELRLEPTQVAAIVRETITLLPTNSREVRVLLHPADAAVLRDSLAPASAERAWQLLEDPVMSRGGCRVESEFARIDARFETRVAAITATLLDSSSAPA